MASQIEADDDSNSIDDDSIEFYSKFGNALGAHQAAQGAGKTFFLGKVTSRLLPLINRAEAVLKYRTKEYRTSKRVNARLHSLLLPESDGDRSNSGKLSKQHLPFTLPKKTRKFDVSNDNNSLKATDTSIHGFKNSTSTNYEPEAEKKLHQRYTQSFLRSENFNSKKQLHSHQTRSIIDSSNIPKVEEAAANSGGAGVSFDRVEVSWIEPKPPVTAVLAVSLFGIVILCILIFYWLKNLLFQRSKCRQRQQNNQTCYQNCEIFGSDRENQATDNLEEMDGKDPKAFQSAGTSRTGNVVETVSSPVDELSSDLENLTLNKTPRNEVLLVDKMSSPIALESSTDSCNSRFIFTPVISSSLSTTTLNPSLFTENQLAGTISIPVPVPVLVPVPIPIPVPIPTSSKQGLLHEMCRSEQPYQQQQESQVHRKFSIRPKLVKSSSTTTSTSSCQSICASSSSRSRRFSLCERRPNSPLAMASSPSALKAHSTSRLTHLRHEDFLSAAGTQPLSPVNVQHADTGSDLSGRQLHNCTDDKENEIPAGGEICSPKMKQSEQVLAEQNSPRNFELPATSSVHRFTFSPKQILNNSENSANHPPVSSGVLPINCHSSPLLTSAVYKHGDYFKFPEVDCLTPDKVNKAESTAIINSTNEERKAPSEGGESTGLTPKTTTPSKAKANLSTQANQATRRARLKSISLDSDGARLVEDNLGIPVEELIEIANQSPKLVDDCFVFDSMTENGSAEDPDAPVTSTKSPQKGFVHTTTKSNSKNKNNLTISIKAEGSFDDGPPDSMGDTKVTTNVQTPKTPTLTQTKQKAISLDSSDTNIIYCLPSSSNMGTTQQHQMSSSNTTSLQKISSISVPTTPKRQQQLLSNAERKLQTGKSIKSRLLTTSTKLALSKSTTSTPSTSFDHDNMQKAPGFISKLRSFNENTIDDGYYDEEHFYLDSDSGMVVMGRRAGIPRSREMSSDLDDESCSTAAGFTGSSSNLLGANLQNQKCLSSLSLSNNNLKTLPEVMTINDFSTDTQQQYSEDDKKNTKLVVTPTFCSTPSVNAIGVQKIPRNSILQRRGSNHSLSLNLNGSLGNLTKSLSVSNYSLGNNNLQTSQCNLSGSSSNLSHSATTNRQTTLNQQSLAGQAGSTTMTNKKNLLQRRGSNTSLTLNIKGSSCMNLNRFNSHSSLNISSTQHQQQHPHHLQHQQQSQPHHSVGSGTAAKKGLLERRNSNASLTLNIQNRALSISNCNLRGSACSLSSVNTNPMDYEINLVPEQRTEQESQEQYDLQYSTATKYRKFLSSENLNNITQCSRLNQTHVRNSTKTCFGSVSDLKPHPLQQQQVPSSQNIYEPKLNYNDSGDGVGNNGSSKLNGFGQSNLCSCTGVRNITTKPLSPQSTSEDFKMYLANIQLLQNATNVLDDDHLRKLNFIFEKSYNVEKEIVVASNAPKLNIADECANDDIIDITINLEAPNDDEQKLLLRNLHQEFWDLPTNYQEKPLVFGSQAKNRYKTILPNEHSRVILDCEPGHVQEPYINANYIKGPDYTQNSYIATQGPMSNTIYEYWLMVHQNVARFRSKGMQQQQQQCPITARAVAAAAADKIRTPIGSNRGVLPVALGNASTTKSNCSSSISGRASNSDDSGNNFCQKIFMLTNFVENNRQKCSVYFPIDEDKAILITSANDKIDSGPLVEFYERILDTRKSDNDASGEIPFEVVISDEGLASQLPKVNWFVVKNCGIRKKNGFTIRKLVCLYCQVDDLTTIGYDPVIFKQRCQKFVCFHYWFPDWPDHRSPSDINVLLDMSLHLLDGHCEFEFSEDGGDSVQEVSCNQQYLENQPLPIIHCSAGIGRTGCLAAILNGLRQMKSSLMQVTAEPPDNSTKGGGNLQKSLLHKNFVNVDVLGIVCNLRLQRGGMVQNSEQYELIHRALCLYLKRLDAERTEAAPSTTTDSEHQQV